jgi:hypothetical protein
MEAGDSKRISYVGSTQTLEFVADMVLSGVRPSDRDVDVSYDTTTLDESANKYIPNVINDMEDSSD